MWHNQNRTYLIALVIIVSVFVFSWYRPGLIIGGAEEGLSFLYPQRTERLFKYTWENIHYGSLQTAEMTRYPYLAYLSFLSKTGIPSDFLQILTFLSLILTGAFFMYLLAKEMLGNKPVYAFLAALFYVFNSFMFANIWHRFLIAMIFFEPILPASVYFLYKTFKTNNIFYLLPFLLFSFFLSASFSLPSNVLTLWAILFILLLSNLSLKNLGWFALFLISWLLTNLWWFVPLTNQATIVYSQVFGTADNLKTLKSISEQFPFLTVITLGYKNMFSLIQIPLSFIMLIVVVFGLKALQSKAWRNFLLITVVLSFFVLNGSNHPTGKIFEFLFTNISPLQLFRNPYEKFGILLVFAYSFLFAFGTEYLSRFSRYISISAVLILGFLFLPLWMNVFEKETNFYVKVPEDYTQVNNLLNQDSDEFRVLQLPLLISGGSAYNWPNKYSGSHPNFYLFDKPSLDGLVSYKEPDNYWRTLREGFYNGKINQLLKYANIKYLLLHKDIDPDYSQTEQTATTLFYLENNIIPGSSALPICPDLADFKYIPAEKKFSLECKFDSLNSDWSNINFLHFELVSNSPGSLRVDIVSEGGQRVVFKEVGKFKEFTFDLRVPTERYAKFSSSSIERLEVSFILENEVSNPELKIRNIYLDSGKQIKNNYLEKILTTSNMELYKIKDELFLSKITPSEKVTQIDSWGSLIKLDQLPESFYLTDQKSEKINYDFVSGMIPDITFEKINNTRYSVNVKNAGTPFWLIFSETFSPDWQARAQKQEFQHFPVNGFANGYFIDKLGDFEINLVYKQQMIADRMKKISASVMIAILVIGMILRVVARQRQTY